MSEAATNDTIPEIDENGHKNQKKKYHKQAFAKPSLSDPPPSKLALAIQLPICLIVLGMGMSMLIVGSLRKDMCTIQPKIAIFDIGKL